MSIATREHGIVRTISRAAVAVATSTAVVLAGALLAAPAAPAAAAPPSTPVPDGVYLAAPWVEAGGRISLQFVGSSGCDFGGSVAFVDDATSTTTPLEMAGYGEWFWTARDFAFAQVVGDDWVPLPIGEASAVPGRVVLSCYATNGGVPGGPTLEFPLVVAPSQPASIYHSPTAWTWYTPGALVAGAPVTVSALGFAPGESVTATLANATRFTGSWSGTAAAPVTATADGSGAVTTTVTLPSGWSASDDLSLLVAGSTSRYLLATAEGEPFNGDPSLKLAANGIAAPGSALAVQGAGYVANETVTIALHSAAAPAVQLGSLTANASGRISGTVTVPSGTVPGGYRLWAGAQALGYHLLNSSLVIGTSERLSAPDRFANAVSIAEKAYPGHADVVYVATGLNYPDALGAGAAAAHLGGPLLLTLPNELPAGVKEAIAARTPETIVVVGGKNSVSENVITQLKTITNPGGPGIEVVRQGGVDRYEASRRIAGEAFDSATHAVISTGAKFPDALSATSAAASVDAPVILVPGTSDSVDAPTVALLDRLGVTSITITGGTASVSAGIEAQLVAKYGAAQVTRLGGVDRFAASVTINQKFFASATEAYIATGLNFPDALAGGVLAATKGAPLVVVHGDCVPAATADALAAWGVTKVTLLGGTASLTPEVARLARC